MSSEVGTSTTTNFLGGIGFALAAAMSYVKWGGFWLAVGHGMLGWLYVFYYLLKYGVPHIAH